MLVVEFYWRTKFRDILPDDSKGIVLVTKYSCDNKSFTYQIDGNTATYLGPADFHDPKYDYLSRSSAMFELNSYRIKESGYAGLPVDQDLCQYTFHVYASETMENQYRTNTGIIFAVSAFAFIMVPFIIFIIYDRKMSRQRDLIMNDAQQSDAIISSIFPANVRRKVKQQQQQRTNSITLNKTGDHSVTMKDSMPIADLYPETTVLFAGKYRNGLILSKLR
jgi:hypothetical protein